MEPAFNIPTPNLIVQIISIAIMIIGPFVAAVVLRGRINAGWRIFWLGALVFIVSQMVLRIPIVGFIQASIAPQLATSPALSFGFGFALAFTAALFETGGRYVGYRFLLKRDPKTWDNGVMFGLGHGGIEATVLVGGIAIAQILALLTTTEAALSAMPALQAEGLRNLAAAVSDGPAWLGLRGAYERVWAVIFHIGMSVLVLQTFARGELRWTWYALALHTAMDFLTPVLIPALVPSGTAQLIVQTVTLTALGGLALAIILGLRPRGGATVAEGTLARAEG